LPGQRRVWLEYVAKAGGSASVGMCQEFLNEHQAKLAPKRAINVPIEHRIGSPFDWTSTRSY